MNILDSVITAAELKQIGSRSFDDMVKAVVDVGEKIIAVDAELHADLETMLLERGSKQADLWGINLYPDLFGTEDFIEFDSMINLRLSQGNRSRGVEAESVRLAITDIVKAWIKA